MGERGGGGATRLSATVWAETHGGRQHGRCEGRLGGERGILSRGGRAAHTPGRLKRSGPAVEA